MTDNNETRSPEAIALIRGLALHVIITRGKAADARKEATAACEAFNDAVNLKRGGKFSVSVLDGKFICRAAREENGTIHLETIPVDIV